MKKENLKKTLACVISFAILVFVAVIAYVNRITEITDILFPSQYIVEGMSIWYVLLATVVAEALIVKLFLKESVFKSVTTALVMNAVSALLGLVALHIVSVIVELLFVFVSVGTFHVSHWIVNFIFIALFNACLEGLTLKIGFKKKFKKMFLCLLTANAVSFIITFLLNTSWIAEMFF